MMTKSNTIDAIPYKAIESARNESLYIIDFQLFSFIYLNES